MNRHLLSLLAFLTLAAYPLLARDLSGQWQGTLPTPEGNLRLVLKIKPAEKGTLTTTMIFLDQSPEEAPVTASLEGSTLELSFDYAPDRYEGTVSDDGGAIAGKWFSGRHPGTTYPLDFHRTTPATAWPLDPSPHQISFVPVADGVRLEVLDWGGSGQPLVFLSGLGDNAHVFDQFAPKFTDHHHVYGITRRGFGASSKPEPRDDNYSADRLGDDVLAVVDALGLNRPVLVGHSIAGEELSSVGSRHPEKIAGLIYLDAAYPYAFYDRAHGDFGLDANTTRAKLLQLTTGRNVRDLRELIHALLQTDLPQLQKSLEAEAKNLDAVSDATLAAQSAPKSPEDQYVAAILAGEQKYTDLRCPALAIYAVAKLPDSAAKPDPSAETDNDRAWKDTQARAFEAGVPTAKVVRIKDADHYVFKSNNEAETSRAMNDFLATLPATNH